MTRVVHPLIHDWNGETGGPGLSVMLDDETLRDGLQSPSVCMPAFEQKVEILHQMEALGIDTADIGLPGAGAHVAADVERLARVIGEERLRVAANCAARTVAADIQPIADIVQRTGVPIECCAFIGSSPVRQFTEGWTLDFLRKTTEEAIGFAVKQGLTVMYVTEDTTRADPDSLRALITTALRAGASRLCVADTVGHATTHGAKAVVGFVKRLLDELGVDAGIDWHGHSDRGFGVASAIAACEAGATRLHGAALGIGERSGNTPMEETVMALKTMYGVDIGIDCTKLTPLANLVRQLTGVAVPANKPIVGDALYQIESGIIASWFKNCGEKFATELFPIRWNAVGQPAAKVVMGKGSGIDSVNLWLQQAGMQVSEEDAMKITAAVKAYSLKNKRLLTEAEFRDLARKTLGQSAAA
jgi:isopropylmalate/homocitrate/citramalate synthase